MEFILWRLPYAAGLGIIHAAACRDGVAMEFVQGRDGDYWDEDDLAAMRRDFERMRRGPAEPGG